jgi:hypothetical protein
MKILARAAAVLFFSFFLGFGLGGTAIAKKIDAEKLAAIKRIGVLSMSGDTLIDRAVGLTAFGNREESYDVADFLLDEEWQSQLSDSLSEASDFEVVSVEPDQRAVLSSALETEDEQIANQALISIAKAAGVDAILIFGSPAVDLYSRGVYLSKYGLFTYSAAFKKRTIYYVSGRLFLFTADGEELDTQYFEGTSAKALGLIPNISAPEELTDVPFSAYSPEQKEFLRSALRDIPRREWAWALKKLLETK